MIHYYTVNIILPVGILLYCGCMHVTKITGFFVWNVFIDGMEIASHTYLANERPLLGRLCSLDRNEIGISTNCETPSLPNPLYRPLI